MKLADVNYYCIAYRHTIDEAIGQFRASFGYVPFLRGRLDFHGIMHFNGEGETTWEGAPFSGFRSKNKFHHIPFRTHDYLASIKPDVVMVQGSIYPLQIIHLRRKLGGQCKIIIQHHGERPFVNSIKRFLQRLADRYVDAYLFTTLSNAQSFIEQKVISSIGKCHEVLEASTYLAPVNRETARRQLGFSGDKNFLWVSRLVPGKDPFTVLDAFSAYAAVHADARLYMLYHTEELLPEIQQKINADPVLNKAVRLVGKVPHTELNVWYSAADFYISGSHREGSGYALIECLACGCIPLVTDIAPFKKVAGSCALYFQPGDVSILKVQLEQLSLIDREAQRKKIAEHFQQELSFRKIADDIVAVVKGL